MQLTCDRCGTVYDVSDYPEGHRFTCTCGRELEVGTMSASGPPGAGPPPTVARAEPDPGLPTVAKVLVFIGNLCFSPLAAIASTVVWIVIRDDRPRTARELCTLTWIPFLLWVLLIGLYMIFVMGLALSGNLE